MLSQSSPGRGYPSTGHSGHGPEYSISCHSHFLTGPTGGSQPRLMVDLLPRLSSPPAHWPCSPAPPTARQPQTLSFEPPPFSKFLELRMNFFCKMRVLLRSSCKTQAQDWLSRKGPAGWVGAEALGDAHCLQGVAAVRE